MRERREVMKVGQYTAAQKRKCAEREAKMREIVYLRKNGGEKLCHAQREEIAMMQEIAEDYRRLEAEESNDLFGSGSSTSS
jgi:hypothetical protein